MTDTNTTRAAFSHETSGSSSADGDSVITASEASGDRTSTHTTLLNEVNQTISTRSPSRLSSDSSALSSTTNAATANGEQLSTDLTTISQLRTVAKTDSFEGSAAVLTTTEYPITTDGDIRTPTSLPSSVEMVTSTAEGTPPSTDTSAASSALSAIDMATVSTSLSADTSTDSSGSSQVPTTTGDGIPAYAAASTPYSPQRTGVSYSSVPGVTPVTPRSGTTLFPPYQGFSINSVSDAVPLIIACVTSTFVLGSIVFVICIMCCRRCRDSKESYSTLERRRVIDAYETNGSPSATHSSRTLPLRNTKPRPNSNAGVIMAYDNQVFNNTFPRRPPPPPSHLPPMIPDYQNYRPGAALNRRPGIAQRPGMHPGMRPKQYLPDGSKSLPRQPAEDLHKGRLSLARGKARPSD
ncbi:hypothetical protein CAPTEDRAFT_212544, partial [Capitella teleta]